MIRLTAIIAVKSQKYKPLYNKQNRPAIKLTIRYYVVVSYIPADEHQRIVRVQDVFLLAEGSTS